MLSQVSEDSGQKGHGYEDLSRKVDNFRWFSEL